MLSFSKNSFNFGYGYGYSVIRLNNDFHLITFSYFGECNDEIQKSLLAKSVAAILIANKYFMVLHPQVFSIEADQITPNKVDYVAAMFALYFECIDDVPKYIEKLRVSKIIL